MAQLRVGDLMTRDPVTLGPEADAREARDLMNEKDIRHVPVVDDSWAVIGLVSQRDIVRRALAVSDDLGLSVQDDFLRTIKLRDIMTRDVESVDADQDLASAGQLMLDNKYGCLPVVDGERLTGILTEADFVRHVTEQL
jgi:CBS domain-containing membrane protein